ncbi:MAG TPA: hypothetical protein VHX66_04645 [Solirubrobacteraceae bacterium]|nr:hypothetical protein [Solirubrobacteraceae bacterium]
MRDRHRLHGRVVVLATLLALLGAAVLIAGCGGASSPGVANLANASTSAKRSVSSQRSGGGVRPVGFVAASPAQRAAADVSGLRFARCMRARGVPNFPDPPAASGGAIGFGGGIGNLDPAAPLFRKAQRTCVSILFRRRVRVG